MLCDKKNRIQNSMLHMTDYGNNNIGKKSKEMHYNDISG